jgi:hypothetical protein
MATTALSPTQIKAALAMRKGRAAGRVTVDQSIQNALAKYVTAEPWIQYDRQFFGAAAITVGNVITLATFPANGELPFFSQRTLSNSNPAFCSVTDVNKFDTDFEAHCCSVDSYMVGDAAGAAGVSNAEAFTEEIVQNGVLQIKFGTDVKFLVPVCKLPAGGGVFTSSKVRTQAAASATDSATTINGFPGTQNRRVLEEPIFFRKNEQFSVSIILNAASTARVRALTALTGNDQAMIGVNFEGLRGKPFLRGSKR